MELITSTTRPISEKLPISSNWFDTSSVCCGTKDIEALETASSTSVTIRSVQDDRNVYVCFSYPEAEIGVAEALTGTLKRPSAMSKLTAFLPYNVGQEQMTQGFSVDPYLQTIRDLHIESLAVLYKFSEQREIREFLRKNVHVLSKLFDVYEQAERFLHGYILSLKLEHSIDTEEQVEGLTVVIDTVLPPDQSLELLERFDEEWWLEQSFELRKVVSVMTRSV